MKKYWWNFEKNSVYSSLHSNVKCNISGPPILSKTDENYEKNFVEISKKILRNLSFFLNFKIKKTFWENLVKYWKQFGEKLWRKIKWNFEDKLVKYWKIYGEIWCNCKWHVDKSLVKFYKKIGEGTFGEFLIKYW